MSQLVRFFTVPLNFNAFFLKMKPQFSGRLRIPAVKKRIAFWRVEIINPVLRFFKWFWRVHQIRHFALNETNDSRKTCLEAGCSRTSQSGLITSKLGHFCCSHLIHALPFFELLQVIQQVLFAFNSNFHHQQIAVKRLQICARRSKCSYGIIERI